MQNTSYSSNRTKINPIKNYLIYLTLYIDRAVLYGVANQSATATNLFYDSMSNSRNANWSPNKKDLYISYLSSAFNLGAFLGPFITIAFSRSNIKYLYILIRILFIVGNFGLCATNSIVFMCLSKFLIGLAFMQILIVTFWYQCHNLLPEHRVQAFNINTTIGAMCFAIQATLSLMDPGCSWYWRICHLGFTAPMILSIIFELTVLKDVNCLSYFTQNGDYRGATDCLEHYIAPEVVKRIIQQKRQDVVDSHQEGVAGRSSGSPESTLSKMKSSLKLLWKDLKTYKKDVLYTILIYILSMGSFFEVIFNLSTYIGAKEMSNTDAVKATKMWTSLGMAGKLVTGFIISVIVPNKRRKFMLETIHTAGVLLMLAISVCYFLKKLNIANICIFLFYCLSALWYSTFYLYPNEILKPSLSSIAYITLGLLNSTILLVVPNFIKFELSSFRQVGSKLLLMGIIGAVFNIVLRFVLVETYDPNKSSKYSPLVEEGEGQEMGQQGDSLSLGG